MEKRKQASLLNFFQAKSKKSKNNITEVVENRDDDSRFSSSLVVESSILAIGNNSTAVSSSSSSPSCSSRSTINGSLVCSQNFSIDDNDIVILKAKSGSNCLELLDLIWKPSENFEFPSSSASSEKFSRKFQYAWFRKYPWLAYSKVEDAAYCKYCVFFASHSVGRTSSQPVGYLVQEGLRKWKRALQYFNNHNGLEYHKTSFLHYTNLKQIHDNKQKSVDVLLDQNKIKEAKENRERLKPIIKTIILCGKQGLALRGHRDHGPIDLDNLPSKNEGNFRALLRFAVECGDKTLEDHLRTAKKNALYTSFLIQNEILETCGSLIQTNVIEQVKKSKYFSVLIDETTDVATVEQMSFCLRYFDHEEMRICENFLCFVPLTSTTAESISVAILKTIKDLGLDIKYLRGQGYDGARVMSGEFRGTQARIAEHQPKAMYVHCMSHCLNLAISDSCQVQDIRNCFGIIEKTCSFLHTPKRQGVLSKKIDEFCPESKRLHLKKLCPTRWVERHDSIMIFAELLDAVCEALDAVSSWTDRDASTGATGLINSIRTVKFMVSLYVSEFLFSNSIILSRYLQKDGLDLVVAVKYAGMLLDQLLDIRKNVEVQFETLFSKVKAMCEKHDIPVMTPRTNNRQVNRFNVDTTDPESYFRISIFIPFLDAMIAEIQNRFLTHKDILSSFSCLVSSQGSLNDFDLLAKFYEDDLLENGAFINTEQVRAEYLLWKRQLSEFPDTKSSIIDMLKKCNKEIFPNVHKLLEIVVEWKYQRG